MGHHSRPSPALVNAVYLWSIHLSPTTYAPLQESAYLQSSLWHLSNDLSGSHPHKVIHVIQAEVLLSFFYLKNGKMLLGNYHANAALSVSLSAGLHSMQLSSIVSEQDVSSNCELGLPPTIGIHEDAQRINAFWGVLILNNYWITIQESHYMFYDLNDSEVSTPWPMEPSDHDKVPVNHISLTSYSHTRQSFMPMGSDDTLKYFLNNSNTEGTSDMALHAKATVLLEQATSIHTEPKGMLAFAL